MRCALPITLGLCALVSARCGTVVHENIVALHGAYQTHEAATAGLPARREKNEEIINVYFYVITANDTLAGGHIPEKAIDKQVGALAESPVQQPSAQSLEVANFPADECSQCQVSWHRVFFYHRQHIICRET